MFRSYSGSLSFSDIWIFTTKTLNRDNLSWGEPDLLRRIAGGDEDAFGRLYNEYRNKTFGYIFDMVKSQTITEDIFQDVFTKIWEQRTNLGAIDNFNAYLFTIIRNKVFDSLRRVAKEHEVILAVMNTTPATSSITDDTLKYHELQAKLQAIVQKLPPKQREVYLLSREKGLKHEEIAEQLNITVTTVNKHITRALDVLRKNLTILLFLVFRK